VVTGTLHEPSPLARSAARGSLVTLIGQGCRLATQFASIAVLARLLSSLDYGYLAMVLALVGVAELLRDFGLSTAAVQARELSHEQQSTLFWLNTLAGFLASLVVLAAAPLVALVYDEPELRTIAFVLAPVFLLNGMAAQFRARINRQMRFVALSVTDVVPQVVAFAVAVVLAFAWRNYWALVAQQLVVPVVGLVLSVALARWWPSWPRRGVAVRSQLRFGLNLFVTNLMSYGVNNSQVVMVGAAWGAVVVGYFSRAYQLMTLPLTQLVNPLTKVALPVLSQVRDDPPRYARIVARAQLLGLYGTAPVFLLCCGLATPLLQLALGPRWSASIPIFAVLSLGAAFRAMSQLAFWLFLSSDSTRAQRRLNAVAYPLMVVLMLAGLPWQGLGVAVGHTVGYALYWPVSLWVACRASGVAFGPLARTAARVSGVVGVGVLLLATAASRTGLPAVLAVLLGVVLSAAYVAAVTRFTRSGRGDLSVLTSFAKGLRR
jgi:O-antigen/teichoic acid export membrane protein